MNIVLWIVVIHLVELAILAGYLLIKKSNRLEKVVVEQQQYIDAISIVINNSSNTIKELDSRGAFEADDEVGTFFRSLKEIQDILNQFNTSKN
jgi:LPS O-antigen subunit length determinant protein (WzzB/FepE family)